MSAITPLKRSLSAIRRNPILIAVVLVTGLVIGIISLIPLIGALAVLFLAPFASGGILGLSERALDGSATLDQFIEAGKENYMSLLGANLLLVGVYLAVMLAVLVPTVLLGVFSPGLDGGSAAGISAVFPFLMLVFFLGALVVGFAVQFFTAAIVIGNASATGSFFQSYHVVRENVVNTLGYIALRIAIGVAVVVPLVAGLGASALGSELGDTGGTASIAILAVAGVLTAALWLLGATVRYTYQAAFYRNHLRTSSVDVTTE